MLAALALGRRGSADNLVRHVGTICSMSSTASAPIVRPSPHLQSPDTYAVAPTSSTREGLSVRPSRSFLDLKLRLLRRPSIERRFEPWLGRDGVEAEEGMEAKWRSR